MSKIFETYRGAVYPWHCDHMGHMNVMHYVGKFDEATWNLFHFIGLTRARLAEARRGMAAVDQHIVYERELPVGSVIAVTSRLVEVREKLIVFEHTMKNVETGADAARTTLKAVHLDLELRKACAFEAGLAEQMRRHAS
ncbi:MAG: thioesterase family protein [Betaproteobacteria bacterium]|nr:thioesterase family protein [Betaproteobacteria bacterium]